MYWPGEFTSSIVEQVSRPCHWMYPLAISGGNVRQPNGMTPESAQVERLYFVLLISQLRELAHQKYIVFLS
jgi:hypothetical protein